MLGLCQGNVKSFVSSEENVQRNSLGFMVNCLHRKLFTSSDMQTIEFCRLQFNFKQIGYCCKKFAGSEFVSMNLANLSCV